MIYPRSTGIIALAQCITVVVLSVGSAHAVAATDVASDDCTASDGDIAVGIQAVPDSTCVVGGLGCFNASCRLCKYSATWQSGHLLPCSSFGYDFPTLAPGSADAGSVACFVAEGDTAVGIGVIDDAACANGGLGCYSSHCRFCKKAETAESTHLGDCSWYPLVTPTSAGTKTDPNNSNAAPVDTPAHETPVSETTKSDTAIPGDTEDTTSAVDTPPANAAANSALVTDSAETKDSGVPPDTLDQTTLDPEAVCLALEVSDGDAEGGVAYTYDPDSCAAGTTTGCLLAYDGCKFCKQFDSDVSSTFEYCPGYPTKVAANELSTETTKTELSADVAIHNGDFGTIAIVAAACVCLVAAIAVVAYTSNRTVRQIRRQSSIVYRGDEEVEENYEDGSLMIGACDSAKMTAMAMSEGTLMGEV